MSAEVQNIKWEMIQFKNLKTQIDRNENKTKTIENRIQTITNSNLKPIGTYVYSQQFQVLQDSISDLNNTLVSYFYFRRIDIFSVN